MKKYNDFDLTQYNSYKIHAVCKTAFFIDEEEDIQDIFLNRPNKRKIILGNGNNIILSKNYYEDDFIIFSNSFNKYHINEEVLEAEAGITMLELSKLALDNSLSGLEIFYDIPSSFGGAVVMNAGASGEEIKGLLQSARYYDTIHNTFSEIKSEEIGFTYRNSFFQKNPHFIITKGMLQLKRGDKQAIKEKMEAIKKARWAKQPKEYPNAGSVFKRPPGKFVGPMIEELGLKSFRIGGAMISEKHAGFIVNFNNATGADIIALIEIIQKKVLQKFEINLELEQRIIT